MRRRLAASVAVAGTVALAHGHPVRPDGAVKGPPPSALRHPGGVIDPHPSLEVSRSEALPPVSLPVASTSTTLAETARTVPPAVRALGHDLGTFRATCYDLRGRTASGAPAGPGSIAVDPTVIPLGTHLRVGSYEGVADDTGGAIHGHRVDVWESSAAECAAFGVRWVDVEAA